MGGKKKNGNKTQQVQKKQPTKKPSGEQPTKQPSEVSQEGTDEEKRFVNLLHIYTLYKKKFRRLSKEEFEELLRHGCKGKRAAIELCKEFMKAKQISDDVSFEKNVGFLSVPRLMPLIALLAERADYKMKPSLVHEVYFNGTPTRFKEKFSQLLVYGFWFLGRVIADSLSVKEQINRGNVFNFVKGDMGFWWAGVRILDWNVYVHREKDPKNCDYFSKNDPPKYRLYTNRAIINMHQHPLYFLSELDWENYSNTIKSIEHSRVIDLASTSSNCTTSYSCSEEESPLDADDFGSSVWGSDEDGSSFLRTYSDASINTLASRESVD